MSERDSNRQWNKRVTMHYDETTGRWHVMNAACNPLYNQDIQLATEIARLAEVDRSVEDWMDCDDAEKIWQKMVDSASE